MPSGRAHETINLAVFAGAALAYAGARQQGLTAEVDLILAPEVRTAFSVSYLIGTFLITPDLDLAENRMQARNNWGLLGLLWVPYGALFSHRGLSHTWVVGPLTRLLYLGAVALALAWGASLLGPYFGYRFSVEAELGESGAELLLGALCGYYLSQWLHLIADGVRPDHAWKRKRSKRRRRARRQRR